MSPFYITTPIYYVNDVPHIGHAYTTVICDVLARYKRLLGDDVYFLTGTDEHGQKVEKSAQQKELDPQALTDQVSQHFLRMVSDPNGQEGNVLGVSNDDFIRTTQTRHKEGAKVFWQKLEEAGYIYLDIYAGWYSVRDEAYYQESELVDGKAPTGADVEWVEEESYFFKLSAFGDKLLDWYQAHPEFIFPKSRANEVIAFVKEGLKDLSISRTTFSWGIDVPGNDKHVMYVWLDALTNYLTALGYPDEKSDKFSTYWPANVHVVGKDILRFHAVYWPAFLMAVGLPLPKQIVAHGWWTNEGEKISKSLGNVIDPNELIDQFGLDPFRYFMLREVSFGEDGNYAKESMINRINAELSNTIGNLAQRTLSMIQKNCDGTIPEVEIKESELLAWLYAKDGPVHEYRKSMDEYRFNRALQAVLDIARKANEFIDKEAPWQLKKDNPKRMQEVLYILSETIRVIAILLQPVTPKAAGTILDQLVVDGNHRTLAHTGADYANRPGTVLPKPEGVFPRHEA